MYDTPTREWAVVHADTSRIIGGPFRSEQEAFTWKDRHQDSAYESELFVAQVADRFDIPMRIHRIWLDDPMPEAFERYGQAWKQIHGDRWDIIEWRHNQELPHPLINQYLFNHARDVFPKDWKRFQADLLRLELLYLYGGIYVDTDCEPLKPFDPLTRDRQILIAHSPNKFQGERILTQAVIGSTPGHPFIRDCIEAVPESVDRYAGRPLAQVVGPHMITRVWKDRGWKKSRMVQPVPSNLFYPQSNQDRDRGKNVDLSQSYCWHRWNNTLRKQGKGLG